ncbi:MAG: hypothetical protein Ct9H90mP5_04280 [Acidimicrobiaceae bacterium]|nr:MAG: hypothetical protein Ct9H90mP5_04280 [Acidimicrobiaceae bacterium]
MFVPLTIKDHLERADLVYGNRIGIIDEPDQPAQPMTDMTYGSFAAKAKAMAKGFEELGVAQQGRLRWFHITHLECLLFCLAQPRGAV